MEVQQLNEPWQHSSRHNHLQVFGILERQKRRRLMTVKIKKKIDRVSPGFDWVDWVPGRPAGSTGFSRANSRAGFCLHPGRVPGRPARLVRVLKLYSKVNESNQAKGTPANRLPKNWNKYCEVHIRAVKLEERLTPCLASRSAMLLVLVGETTGRFSNTKDK
jgi:hypothetical protein